MAWLCLTALLFLQLAVAAYACTTRIDGGTPVSATMGPGSQPCEGMDQQRPKLCEQHCVYASQSVDTQPHSAVHAPVLPSISVVQWPDLQHLAQPKRHSAFLVTVVDPPPLIRFGVLRI